MGFSIELEAMSLVIIVILALFHYDRNNIHSKRYHLFNICLILTACAIISNIATCVMLENISAYPMGLHMLVNSIYFIAINSCFSMVAAYVFTLLFAYMKEQKCYKIALTFVIVSNLVLALLVIVNIWTGCYFYFENNVYCRGPLNKLGFIISTKYPTIDNPFEDEVKYSKKVLDGLEKDETRFSLLYEPDKTKNWETDDMILKQSNPVSLEIPEIWEDLVKKRAFAVAVESARENFVCKHCNIIYQGTGTESYVDVKDLQECKQAKIDWKGRVVYVGLDLSESNDNTSVSMVTVDDNNNILADSFAFIPEGRIEEKTASEKVNYRELIRSGKVIACGDKVIDYAVVEDFILSLETKYGVQIQAIGYDRWNALSTAQKLERAGYNLVEIRQHSSVLHPPTKLLKEKILAKEFGYENNTLLEINFQNARCTYDTNKNMYVHKKKSTGKVDMVVSMINAIYLLQQDVFLNQMDFAIQVF